MRIRSDGLREHFSAAFWKYPYSTFLKRPERLNCHRHNVCVLKKRLWDETTIFLGNCMDIVTAFYFPLVPWLQFIEIESPSFKTIWAPGSECPPRSLNEILSECRAMPAAHVNWNNVLALARHTGNPSHINHDFPKEMHIDGITYRRFEPVIPFIVTSKLVRLHACFTHEFSFFIEEWYLPTQHRDELAKYVKNYSLPTRPTHTRLPHQLEFQPLVEVGMPLEI